MTTTPGLSRGRAIAERLMVDTCTIARVSAGTDFNDTTGGYSGGSSTPVYDGACRVKPKDNADRVVQFGEQAVSFWPFLVAVPMSVTGVQLDDVVTITASESDPSLIGVQLRVREVPSGSQLTARRLGCERNAG